MLLSPFMRNPRGLANRKTSDPKAAVSFSRSALAALLLLLAGCSRSYLIYAPTSPGEFQSGSIAVVPIQLEWQERGLGRLTDANSANLEIFRDTLTESTLRVLENMGIQGVAGLGPTSALPKSEQRNLVFESELERRKVLTDLDLQDSFSWYARRVARPSLDSLASTHISSYTTRLNVAALLIMRFKAVKLSGTEYWREWIRALLVTFGSLFLDTTLAHRSYITGDVLLIDGVTGRALFYNRANNFAGAPDSADDTRELIRQLLEPLQSRLL